MKLYLVLEESIIMKHNLFNHVSDEEIYVSKDSFDSYR